MIVQIAGTPISWTPWDNPNGSPGEAELRQEYDAFKPFISKGDVAVDIGAHIGDTTLPLAMLAGDTGLVLAFEPNPIAFTSLWKNVQDNPALNIECHNVAIMPEDGVYFFDGDKHLTNGFVQGAFTTQIEVVGRNLLRYALFRKISFIKIDTEGKDHFIIRSVAALIKRDRPIIRCEVFSDLDDEYRRDYLSAIQEIGYKLGPPESQEEPTLEVFMARYAGSVDCILSPPPL